MKPAASVKGGYLRPPERAERDLPWVENCHAATFDGRPQSPAPPMSANGRYRTSGLPKRLARCWRPLSTQSGQSLVRTAQYLDRVLGPATSASWCVQAKWQPP